MLFLLEGLILTSVCRSVWSDKVSLCRLWLVWSSLEHAALGFWICFHPTVPGLGRHMLACSSTFFLNVSWNNQ